MQRKFTFLRRLSASVPGESIRPAQRVQHAAECLVHGGAFLQKLENEEYSLLFFWQQKEDNSHEKEGAPFFVSILAKGRTFVKGEELQEGDPPA